MGVFFKGSGGEDLGGNIWESFQGDTQCYFCWETVVVIINKASDDA